MGVFAYHFCSNKTDDAGKLNMKLQFPLFVSQIMRDCVLQSTCT